MEYNLDGTDFINLCDLLKALSLVESGGQAKFVIANGEVQVDGELETRKRKKIRAGQNVSFAGQKILVLP
jgi:ribosome-associated protein